MADAAMIAPQISILKTMWSREKGTWAISGMRALELHPKANCDPDYFSIESRIELLSQGQFNNLEQVMASVGPTEFLLRQSIVPVVAWRQGDDAIRCIGTGSLISCSGLIVTAGHVLMDPIEAGYGVAYKNNEPRIHDELNFGVFIPFVDPLGRQGLGYFPIREYWVWAHWKKSPLLFEPDRLEYRTDVAVCKIDELPNGLAHQPLNMSLNPFSIGEAAYSIGYAEMSDIPIEYKDGKLRIAKHAAKLFVSIGEVTNLFPQNHIEKASSVPGPCFTFEAKIPGKMSGAPVFGGEGAIIRGVISKSWSGERDASGVMLGPAMRLPLNQPGETGRTLLSLMHDKTEGIGQVFGAGL
ncbi:trypsin-like peptidase domain-containing protein [Hyphomicrobium sp. LHD-15]|uniref:trypsin-like peptidase domain-containing protein n=1 Tax=Hyphomicrobium sp. LHD-15 TaxID=3072142 RepID=UPI00280EBB22|nr:trypsin-like peptidase domain-containing protein [Hyphomicrobium sp. LHD-15]MDQ8699242.1 hypothetical protein [Hyphomicrobium sp. LHD-15]